MTLGFAEPSRPSAFGLSCAFAFTWRRRRVLIRAVGGNRRGAFAPLPAGSRSQKRQVGSLAFSPRWSDSGFLNQTTRLALLRMAPRQRSCELSLGALLASDQDQVTNIDSAMAWWLKCAALSCASRAMRDKPED